MKLVEPSPIINEFLEGEYTCFFCFARYLLTITDLEPSITNLSETVWKCNYCGTPNVYRGRDVSDKMIILKTVEKHRNK